MKLEARSLSGYWPLTRRQPRDAPHASREHGAALVIAVILIIVMAALAAALLKFITAEWKDVASTKQEMQALSRGILRNWKPLKKSLKNLKKIQLMGQMI